MSNISKRSLKTHIKHYAPEILAGVTLVTGVGVLVYLNRSSKFPMNPMDTSIKIIAETEEALVVLSESAAEILEAAGDLTIDGGPNGPLYMLSIISAS